MKIYYKNSKNWAEPYAVLLNTNEHLSERVELTSEGVNKYSLDFDNEMYDHLYFADEGGERSSKIYPGSISVGVEYKHNCCLDRNLTYLFSSKGEKSGRVDNYTLVDEKNLSHRTDKSKKISIFVPESYDGVTPHDILYFFDAQNLYCEAGSYTGNGDPYGSWQLDTVVNELHDQYGENIIVVGIDNADEYRSHELFMNPEEFGELSALATSIPDDDFSRGYLDGLSSFIRTTLHSFVKANYCVKEDNIGLGGSSMGGIASFYCGLREKGFFRYILSYSPAFGLYEMSAFEKYFAKQSFSISYDLLPKIHIYCGGGDMLEENLLPSSKAMKSVLTKYGYDGAAIHETYDMEKPHNEESWRLILPLSFSLLFDL